MRPAKYFFIIATLLGGFFLQSFAFERPEAAIDIMASDACVYQGIRYGIRKDRFSNIPLEDREWFYSVWDAYELKNPQNDIGVLVKLLKAIKVKNILILYTPEWCSGEVQE